MVEQKQEKNEYIALKFCKKFGSVQYQIKKHAYSGFLFIYWIIDLCREWQN